MLNSQNMSFQRIKNLPRRFCMNGFDTITGNHNDLIPSLGARIDPSSSKKLPRYILSPLNPHYRAWEMLLALLVVYSAWISPFEIAFPTQKHNAPLLLVDNIVNCFFAADIVLTFFVAYLDSQSHLLIDDPKRIAVRYLSTWFAFDICSTVPLRSIVLHFTSYNGGLGFDLLSMLRLWRLRRASSLFARFEKDIRFNYLLIRCTKLALVTLLAVHCAGCFNYALAERYPDLRRTWIGAVYPDFKQMGIWDRYVTSLYCSIVTLTTTGYGDFHAQNPTEMAFGISYMFCNLGLIAYLIGNMTNLVVQCTCHTSNFRDCITAALEFSKRNQVPRDIQDQMVSYICLKFKTERFKHQEILKGLPKALCFSIAHCLFLPVVQNARLFDGVSQKFLLQLVAEMEAEYFPPGEDLIQPNESATDLYILVSGAVDLIAKINGNDRVIRKVASSGEMFGEIGILSGKPQPFGVRTTKVSQILQLEKTKFLSILLASPEDKQRVMHNLYQNWNEWKSSDLEIDLSLIMSKNWLDGGPNGDCNISTEDNNVMNFNRGSESAIHQAYHSKGMHDLMLNYLSKKKLESAMNDYATGYSIINGVSSSSSSSRLTRYPTTKPEKKVTIHHMNFPRSQVSVRLMILPHSLEELLKIAGQIFGDDNLTRVVNAENAEIDDLSVVRDGDHLFLSTK